MSGFEADEASLVAKIMQTSELLEQGAVRIRGALMNNELDVARKASDSLALMLVVFSATIEVLVIVRENRALTSRSEPGGGGDTTREERPEP